MTKKWIIRVDVHHGYSIERENDGSYSCYSIFNSMYDVHSGFKTVEAAKQFIDNR